MPEVKVVHPDELEKETVSGAITSIGGVSRDLTGAEGIYMGLSTIPPGGASSSHHHTNCESAIYVVSGYGKIRMGDRLAESQDFGPGDFIFIPPFALHQPVNISDTEPVALIVARNSPVEIVEEYAGPLAEPIGG